MRWRWPWRSHLDTPSPEDRERLDRAEQRVTERHAEVARHSRETKELARYFRDQTERNHLVERLRDALGG